MPSLKYYDSDSKILTDKEQLHPWRIHKQSFKCGKLIAKGKDIQIWLVSEDLSQYLYDEWNSLVEMDDTSLTYIMLETKRINTVFDKKGYLKTKKVIGYIQVTRSLLNLRKNQVDKINPRYLISHDDNYCIRASEINLSYITERFRGKGYGKFFYRWALYEEKILQSGWCLHSHKDKVTGSLAIWKNILTKHFKPVVWDKTTRKLEDYKENQKINWKKSSRTILVSCGKIVKKPLVKKRLLFYI